MIDNSGLNLPDFMNGVEGGQVVVDVNVSHIRFQLELLSGNQEGLVDKGVGLDRVGVPGREHLDPFIGYVECRQKARPYYKFT